jgi:hypothetical protein
MSIRIESLSDTELQWRIKQLEATEARRPNYRAYTRAKKIQEYRQELFRRHAAWLAKQVAK